jgi:hypothetical protein
MLIFSLVAAIAFGCQNSFPGQVQSNRVKEAITRILIGPTANWADKPLI